MVANVLKRKIALRIKRKKRIRAKISGCESCPRVSIFKSNRTLYAQVINDVTGTTICASNGGKLGIKANKAGGQALAKDLAEKMKGAKIENAVFDRNGYLYHGVVASFGEALKANGIKL